jgi:predicted O-linked N-acetylglucosamine transferase (SPINDLY family)
MTPPTLGSDETGARVKRGLALLHQGEADAARRVFAELLEGEPQSPQHLLNLARAKAALGDRAAAEADLRQAVALKPDFAEAWLQLATLAIRADVTLAILGQGLALNADHPALLEAKALTLRLSGQLRPARAFLEALEARAPDAGWVHFHLGDLLAETDRARALVHLRRAVALEPDNLDHLVALIQGLEGVTAGDEGERLDEAFRLCESALVLGGLRPGHTKVLRDVFSRVCAFGPLEALGDFRGLGRSWARSGLHSAFLKQLGRVGSFEDRLELLEQHRIWGRAVAARAAQAPIRHPSPRAADGRIRLGFMSSDLRRHPVSFFALPLFDHIDRTRFDIYCYSFYRGPEDALQAYITRQAAAFRWAPDISARDAAQMIADDQLDMLIELGGPTQMNKPEVMAYRPAPRQASWLGYPHSVGLEAIDHFICDPFSAPTDPGLLVEAPLVMPQTWIALGKAVFEGHPDIDASLPQDRTGRLTFGTANSPHKYTRDVLRTWARVVAGVPQSCFAFVRPEAASAAFRSHVLAAFAAEGVGEDRVVFHAVRGAHMAFYNTIDISLDTFPLTGGTTTAEALWMGVPVVSLKGPAFYERLSYSILTNAGLGDLATDDTEAFVQAALKLAADKPRRLAIRRTLREQITRGPLGRTEDFARDFYDMVARVVGRA